MSVKSALGSTCSPAGSANGCPLARPVALPCAALLKMPELASASSAFATALSCWEMPMVVPLHHAACAPISDYHVMLFIKAALTL